MSFLVRALTMQGKTISQNVEQDVQNPDQIDEDSSSSASTGGKRPATNTELLPENVEQDKQKKSVSRKFHTEWENLYLVSEYKTKPICLICRHEFTQIKKFSFERHFNTTHIAFSQKYPESSKKRLEEMSRLKNELMSEQKVWKKFMNENDLVTRASYDISFGIAKHGKPYSDGEFHKRLMQATVETLCENWAENPKSKLLENIQKLPLSHQTWASKLETSPFFEQQRALSDECQCEPNRNLHSLFSTALVTKYSRSIIGFCNSFALTNFVFLYKVFQLYLIHRMYIVISVLFFKTH